MWGDATFYEGVNLGAELKGIAAKLAGASAEFALDTVEVNKRLEGVEATRAMSVSREFKGDFEINYEGVTLRVG